MAESNKILIKEIIVVASGGFDPIHPGHIRLLKEAKKLGHRLIVLLNNDNWLMAKKGYVFMSEQERKEIIEAIVGVDRVFLTEHKANPTDMSVCRELLKLKPHIFVNGGDRHKDNIPETDICNRINCQMVFNVGYGGKIQSSSWLLNKYNARMKLKTQADESVHKKVIIFDLDSTLTASKANLDKEMSVLLCKLLKNKIVAVMGGGSYVQFQKQFLKYFQCPKKYLKKLFLLPACGSAMYQYDRGKWNLVYQNNLTSLEKKTISDAFKKACKDINYIAPRKTYGKVMEDRGSQITFSLLGQRAPLDKKLEWNKNCDIRPVLKPILEKYLPDFEVRFGGKTSIDVNKKGIDKAYGIRQIEKFLSIPVKEMVYIGDDLREGGNDFAVFKTGISTIPVVDFQETKYLIKRMIA